MLANSVSPPVNRAVMTGRDFRQGTTNTGICLQTSDNVWVLQRHRFRPESRMRYEHKLMEFM